MIFAASVALLAASAPLGAFAQGMYGGYGGCPEMMDESQMFEIITGKDDGDCPSVGELSAATPQLRAWNIAMEAGDLSGEFTEEDESFTILVPTNKAWEAADADVFAAVFDESDNTAAALGLHVIEGVLAAEDLTDGAELTTYSGDTLTVSLEGDTVYFVSPTGNAVSVLAADITLCNGLAHIVDGILVPDIEIEDK